MSNWNVKIWIQSLPPPPYPQKYPTAVPSSIDAKPDDEVSFQVMDATSDADIIIFGQQSLPSENTEDPVKGRESPFSDPSNSASPGGLLVKFLNGAANSPSAPMTVKTPLRWSTETQPNWKPITYKYGIIVLVDDDATIVPIDPTVIINPP